MARLPKDVEPLVKVLTKTQTYEYLGLSDRTWQRMEQAGETPVKTQLSQGRVGYRLCDIISWLEERRMGTAPAE
jgi:predicted DNA-binding transcriptional regulator AlpA